ncbi:MAG: S-layer homology domain-containing protein [Candidatus Gracilibacteria bacterium]
MSNLFKKITSATMALLIVLSIVSPISGVMAAYSTLESANKLASLGVIVDNSANPANYRLGDSITRGEMAKVTMKLSEQDVVDTCEGKFTDLVAADWACKYAEAGLANGYFAANPTFRPQDSVTKIEALKMVMQARGIAKSSNTDWMAAYVEAGVEAGILDASFTDYNTVAVRGWIFQNAVNAIEGMADDGSDLLGDLLGDLGDDTTSTGTTDTTSTGTVATTGDLTVDLSPSSTMAQSVPKAGTVNFGTFDFTAGNEDVTLTSVKLVRQGLGSRSDFTRVWMEKNGVRISGRQTVGSDDTVYITFSPAFVIKAGSTESLDLIATLSGVSSNSQNKFTIVSASDIDSTASVGGNFPISTETMTTTSYTVVPVVFETAGSASTYRAGNTNVELGQFKLTNNSTDDKSVNFKAITLRNDGTGDASLNLANLGVYRNGVKVSSDVTFDGKSVTFAVNDTVAFGRTETYYIRGDVVSAELTTGDSYIFTLRYTDDLSVDEVVTGFRSTITTTSTTMATYSVSGGDIILSKSTSSPSSQTVAPGTNDAVLLSADLKVSQPITLEDLKIGFAVVGTGDLSKVFSSIKLMIGNSVVATYTPGSTPITLGAKGILAGGITLEGTTTVNADTTLKILGNVKTNALTGSYTLSNVVPNDFSIREYASNGNAIQLNQMVGSCNGVATAVGSATLTMTRNDGIAPQTLSIGSSNQTLTQFSMRANDVSDVTVTKLTFATGGSTNVNTTNVTNVRLMINGETVSTKNMSTGNADFNDINVKITKNSDVTVKVVADFSTAVASGELFQIALSAIEARDANSVNLPSSAIIPPSNGPLYTFAGAGSATFTLNSSTPTAIMLTPASSEIEVARYTLAATDDSLKLTDLYVMNNGTADLSSSIKSIGLYDTNGNKLAGGSVLGTGTVQFALGSSSTFIIPKNTSNSVVIVKAAFNDVTDATQTNKIVQLAVGYKSGISPVSGTTAAGARLVSEATGNEVTSVTSSAVANAHLLVRSKPVVAISTSATASTHTFTVTADANNRITLTGATFSITNPSATGGTFTIYKDSENSGNVISTGTIDAAGVITPTSFTQTEISAGTSKTFIFKVSTELQSAAVNSKRIFRVQDLGYLDMMNTGLNQTISNISAYSNVGLPSVESTFTY